MELETTRGVVRIEMHPEWAPHASARFDELVEEGFFNGGRFYRVVPGFVVQAGLNPDPTRTAAWLERTVPDDRPVRSNLRGTVALARTGRPNSATTQFYVNLGDHPKLDQLGFAPFGCVSEGMDVVDRLYGKYGECAPVGHGPNQRRVIQEGEAYLAAEFPKLDSILRTRSVR